MHIIARPGALPGLLRALGLGLALLLPGTAAPLVAQEQAQTQAPLPVLTLDVERLFEQTRWGKAIMFDLAQETAALTAENNRIADDLIAEEKALTDRRASLAAEVFRAEADAFDERATGIRKAQKAKSQVLTQSFENQRQGFYASVAPLMDELLAARGAVVLLDRRAVIRGLEAADITDELVALVDARIGDGPKLGPESGPDQGAENTPAFPADPGLDPAASAPDLMPEAGGDAPRGDTAP